MQHDYAVDFEDRQEFSNFLEVVKEDYINHNF